MDAGHSAQTRHVTVYERTKTGFPRIGPYVRSTWERRPLIWAMTRTEIRAENYNTVFGQLWIVLNPLFLAAVYLLVRMIIRPMGSPAERNALISHLVMGVFFFTFTSDALTSGARAILGNKHMILNTAFPRAVFPLTALSKALLDFIPMVIVYLGLHTLLGQPNSWYLAYLPLLIGMQAVFNLGCVFLFSALSVFFHDTINFLRYVTRLWLFATPVLYTVSEIPANLQPILRWNPLYPFFGALEQIFDGQPPGVGYLLAAGAWAAVALVVGVLLFLSRERDFALRF
jgi:teichoic acid transport system permease protein